MSPRPRLDPFEKAKNKYESVINIKPIGRAALLNSVRDLEDAGKTQQAAGSLTMSEFAETMHDVLVPINETEYTKPPLASEQLAELIGKRSVYAMIAQANTSAPEVATAPTDTKKIDTAKRKG